jgi:uncharacterized protein (DUF2342 family)
VLAARQAGRAVEGADEERLARYAREKESIRADAEACRARSEGHLKAHARLSLAATASQIGIALGAVALLLRRNVFWALALAAGSAGIAWLAWGLLG